MFVVPISYTTNIDKNNIIEIENLGLNDNNFDIINSYCKMSNKKSIIPIPIYKEFFIAEIAIDDANELVGNPEPENKDFYICSDKPESSVNYDFTNNNILKTIPKYTTEKWVDAVYDKKLTWYKTAPPGELTFGKESAELFVAFNEDNPTKAFIIFNQS